MELQTRKSEPVHTPYKYVLLAMVFYVYILMNFRTHDIQKKTKVAVYFYLGI